MISNNRMLGVLRSSVWAVILLTTLGVHAENIAGKQGAYVSIGYSQVTAKEEADLNLNPRTVPIHKKSAFTFLDGYQFTPYMSAELGVTHLGAATDIFSIFARLRTPIWNKFAANVKYGASFANSRIRGVYSGGIDYFANRKNSIGIQYSRQYTYTQLEAVKGQGNAYPTDWFTDIKYMQPIRLLALKYTRYMDRCDSSCWRERPPVYARGEYVGFGLAELSRHLGFGYYQNNPLNDNVDTGSSYAGQETDNMLGYELIHGNQITPYFGMEFGVAGSSKENYLNFYTVSGRFTIPLLSSIRPYVKFGALYTNETDFGWVVGVGGDFFMTRDTALGLAFQRLDVGDAFKQQYYDLTTLSLRHYYGIDDWRKDKNVAPQPQVESDWLAWADKGRAEIERGLYYGIIAGGESARIKEDSPYHKLDIPFDGVGGITMFGYGLPFKHRYYVGVEGYIGRSGAVFRPHDETGSSYDNLYMSTVYKDSYYKDYYYGGRLLLGILNSNANLAFIHAGTVQADWSIITASGINKAPKYRDRYGKFFFDNSAELAGKGYLQTDGVMVGMGHEIPITSKLFIRMEYDYTHFSQASEKPSNTISASKDYTYTYHPQSDQFLLGMKYRLGSKRGVNWRGMASRYSTGWYVSGAIYDDFHHITQKFGVTEPSYVNWSAGEAEIFGSHKVPKDFFADGLAGQMQLSHRWMRHVGEADIMLGLEGGFAVLNSQYSYQRKQYFVYTDPNTNVPYDTPSLDFSYRFVNKGSLGGLMGYQVNAEDMLMFKVDFVSTLVKRTGFEKDFRPAAVSPEQRLRSFGRNFSRRIEGWQFTLSNDFAMTRSLGLTLGCSFTRYGSFRIEDENILISHGDNKTVKNHYYGYRVTDMGYLIGLRYRLG